MPASSLPALSGLRAAVGVGAWATPNVSGRLFGLDPVSNPQASYVGRLFGARDLALAAGTPDDLALEHPLGDPRRHKDPHV